MLLTTIKRLETSWIQRLRKGTLLTCSSMAVSISWIWEEKLSHSFWRPSVIANISLKKNKRLNSNCYELLYGILSFVSIHATKKSPQSVKSFQIQPMPWTAPRYWKNATNLGQVEMVYSDSAWFGNQASLYRKPNKLQVALKLERPDTYF